MNALIEKMDRETKHKASAPHVPGKPKSLAMLFSYRLPIEAGGELLGEGHAPSSWAAANLASQLAATDGHPSVVVIDATASWAAEYDAEGRTLSHYEHPHV